jgi:hypothetical protein
MAILAVTADGMAVLPVLWRELSLSFVDDAYAVREAEEMVVDDMKDQNGQWPKGWDDLRPHYDAGGGIGDYEPNEILRGHFRASAVR